MKTPEICPHPRFKVDQDGVFFLVESDLWRSLSILNEIQREDCQSIQCCEWLKLFHAEIRNDNANMTVAATYRKHADDWLNFDWE